MNKSVYIAGAGGHAKVVIDIFKEQGVEILGLLDDDNSLHKTEVLGIKVSGGLDWLEKVSKDDHKVNISVGTPSTRAKLYDEIANKGFDFISAVHPKAVISTGAIYGSGCIINAGVVIHPAVNIGENVIIGINATISHDVRIGSHVHISPGVHVTGEAQIGSEVDLGVGSVILPGVNVGNNAVVGAGAVVLEDVREGATVVGVPAREV